MELLCARASACSTFPIVAAVPVRPRTRVAEKTHEEARTCGRFVRLGTVFALQTRRRRPTTDDGDDDDSRARTQKERMRCDKPLLQSGSLTPTLEAHDGRACLQ